MRAWSRTWRLTGFAAVAAGAALLYGCSDKPSPTALDVASPSYQIPGGALGYDLNDYSGSPQTINGALWYFPVPYKVGTGLINPFLSIQNNPEEEGFNTDASKLPLDDTRPNFTNALPLNVVPIIKDGEAGGGALFREVILDANEANSTPDAQFSIDYFDVFLCKDANAPTYDQVSDFDGGANCTKIYNFEPGYTGFATDAATQGSGNALDYDILIPNDKFEQGIDDLGGNPNTCPYNPDATSCGIWVVVHTHMGGFGGDWVTGSTFEELSTILKPYITVSKTATPEFTRTYLWKIEKSVDPTDITLFNGQSQDAQWTVTVSPNGSSDGGWQVTGAVTITNPSSSDASITSITDLLEPGDIPVTLDCGVELPYTIASDETLVCNYTYTFASDPGSGDYQNTVSVELAGLAVTSAMSDVFSFTTPTTEVNKTVNVTDTYEYPGGDVTALGSTSWDSPHAPWTYSRTYTCGDDNGEHPNQAEITETGQTADASVTVNCLDVDVTKDAATSLQRTYHWTIDKSVTPDTWNLFDGDDGTSDYTVTATPNGYDDGVLNVSGKIHITNTDPNGTGLSVYVGDISDELSDATVATVDNCSVDGGGITTPSNGSEYELAAGKTIDCDYSATPPSETDGTNTATVTAKPTSTGTAKDFTGTADYDWASATTNEVNKTIHVTDTYPYPGGTVTDLGTSDWDSPHAPFTYSRTFSCGTDEGTHDNRAEITETGDHDDASVTVNCYDLSVTKDAATSWNRKWNWTIDKKIDESCFLTLPSGGDGYDAATHTATIQQGETLDVCYTATLDAASTDSDWHVAGDVTKITIHNNNPSMDADLTQVLDQLTGGIDATVDCPSSTVPADGDLVCDYSADLPDGTSRTNTATATQQNHHYASDGTPTDAGTTDYSGTASVVFSSTPTVETDECVDVTDALKNGGVDVGSKDFGTYCAGDGVPHDFNYSYTFGPNDIPVQCGPNRFDNTATFVTNDTQTSGFDAEYVNIDVNCQTGCTLTQGYWKTHNDSFRAGHNGHGPATDATWALLDAWYYDGGSSTWVHGDGSFDSENEMFFLSGQTWYDVFQTPPKGNAYYNLAHQYMAAVLNVLAGADPSAISQTLLDAQALFEEYTPADIGALHGKTGQDLKQQFIDLAGTLDDYNQGLIGPGHCTENSSG